MYRQKNLIPHIHEYKLSNFWTLQQKKSFSPTFFICRPFLFVGLFQLMRNKIVSNCCHEPPKKGRTQFIVKSNWKEQWKRVKGFSPRYIEYYKVVHYHVFWKSKQIICLPEGWVRWKTVSKSKQIYFIPQMV